MRITRRGLGLAAAALPLAAPAVLAQGGWPARTVRVIVPWPPGGSTDVLTRMYAERLQALLGQSFIVENRPGAGGNIGIEAVAKAAPDGTTIGIASVGHFSINHFLYRQMPFDADRDLVPVALAWELPNVAVVVPQHVPVATLAEFIAWARAQPQGYTYGSPGVGSTPHLSGALFAARLGLNATHVPFRGAAQTIPTMLAGDVRFAIDNLASYIPVLQDGRMRALAVTSARRWPTLPEVPTMGEAGVPDFVVTSWQGFVVPRGTPAEIVSRLSQTLRAITEEPAMRERFLQAGATIAWSTPEELAARARRERPMWEEAVRLSGATAG
ncbi:MAG: tripartite tricarboxylate transporter substrate binding protein [Acetobacteraceae bacterium]|nr:tripartite tricarboxylate transporter substrate binding protein [Acetobacteraceae bacterium]